MRIAISAALAGQRLDKLLVDRIEGLGRARARRWFAGGRVSKIDPDGRRYTANKGELSAEGWALEVDMDPGELQLDAIADAEAEFGVALETPDLVVVDKPAGMPSAPLRAAERGTLAGGLLARFPEMKGVGFSMREPGLCHRLDTDTSGLLVCARNTNAFDAIASAIRAQQLDKRYLLVCPSQPLAEHGDIELPLLTDKRRRVHACRDEREAARQAARQASTHYVVVRRSGDRALVEARAARAHRHQIRAHFAAIGAPLVGDELYGSDDMALSRHALHASRIAYSGDDSIAPFDVSSPLPPELDELVAKS
jgi:23S rRNA pseudouridine1911/1915/1917 synthase